MSWEPTTDDEFSPGVERAADGVFQSLREFSAGQAEVSGFAKNDEERKVFSVVVAEGPSAVVAIHVDWNTQTVVTAWRA